MRLGWLADAAGGKGGVGATPAARGATPPVLLAVVADVGVRCCFVEDRLDDLKIENL